MEMCTRCFTNNIQHCFLGLLDFILEVGTLVVVKEYPLLVTHVRLSDCLVLLPCLIQVFISWLPIDLSLIKSFSAKCCSH